MPRQPQVKKPEKKDLVVKQSVIDNSGPAVSQTALVSEQKRPFRSVLKDWRIHVKTGWKEMRQSGSWKTPVKVLVVTCIAVGVGVGVALVVLNFA